MSEQHDQQRRALLELKVGDVLDFGDWRHCSARAPVRVSSTGDEPDAIWTVVQSEHRQERRAEEALKEWGFRTFLPKYMARVKRSKYRSLGVRGIKTELVERVLFPGYLFMRTVIASAEWKRAFSCLGVHGMLCAGDLPARVPDREIAKIMHASNCGLSVDCPDAPFAIGDMVRVEEGPFSGFDALVEDIKAGTVDEAAAVRILLNLFGRKTRIILSADALGRV